MVHCECDDACIVGMRVQLAPHTDRWMMGDRYGEVVGVTTVGLRVKLDKSGRTIRLRNEDVCEFFRKVT